MGCKTYASAVTTKVDHEKPFYELIKWPITHACVPPTTLVQSKKFLRSVKDLIEKNPTKSIGQCYKEMRSSFTSKMTDDNEKQNFLTEIPSLETCRANLYKFRNRFIPKNPATSVELDTNSDWFKMFDSNESICMADVRIGNKTSVFMTTKKNLELMARSRGLAVDGTFQSCRKQWYQLLVISGKSVKHIGFL